MSTFWPGLRGLTPCRAARCCTLNLPNPVKVTSPPDLSVSEMVPSTASTALPASRLEIPVRPATCSMNSLFVTTDGLRLWLELHVRGGHYQIDPTTTTGLATPFLSPVE